MRSFRAQYLECIENETVKKIDCGYPYPCPGEINLCTKYLEVCSSKVCKKERMNKDEFFDEDDE